jgi:hypothetical protein
MRPVTAQPEKEQILLSTSESIKKSVVKHKGDGNDDNDDVSNHLKCKHTLLYT